MASRMICSIRRSLPPLRPFQLPYGCNTPGEKTSIEATHEVATSSSDGRCGTNIGRHCGCADTLMSHADAFPEHSPPVKPSGISQNPARTRLFGLHPYHDYRSSPQTEEPCISRRGPSWKHRQNPCIWRASVVCRRCDHSRLTYRFPYFSQIFPRVNPLFAGGFSLHCPTHWKHCCDAPTMTRQFYVATNPVSKKTSHSAFVAR